MSSEQFEFKVMQKNVTTEETVQQQNDALADIRNSLSGIRLGFTNVEKLMKFLFDIHLSVVLDVDATGNKLSTLKNDIQDEIDDITKAELWEASMEGTISDALLDSNNMQKTVSTVQETLQFDLIYILEDISYIKKKIKRFQESIKESKNVFQEVKEKVAPTEEKLLILANCIGKQLDHFLVEEISEAVLEETMSVEKFDSKDMLKNTATKETVQKQNDIVAIILKDFIDIRKEMTNLENFFEESEALLQNIERKISKDEKNLSALEKSRYLAKVIKPICVD